ncbi:serine hydrolase [Segetibacter sp.]|jgi:CubicO group peptidase (beta-lactamase class C family)|uniref:serine hydrolase n=1 Tax=Segetibacter sp. TaxID=2231182 RepID=UPI002633BE66|nr:serine hydrolase [Segetibacter sp.]MCW3081779.1 beta-lactamase [Segetibacter sp.]
MKKVFLIVITVFFLNNAFGQAIQEKLDSYMQALTKYAGFNGAVLVAKDGNILLEKGYGLRNAQAGITHDENSVFQIGSVTKQFTATIIQQLELEGKLSLKDTLSKFFPQYQYANRITIENLLNHVSGIYNYTQNVDFMQNHATESLGQTSFWSMIKDKPLSFEPGSKFNYSNSGYLILGYLIEKVTGQPYESVVRKYLFEPAGMSHSGFDFTHLASPVKSVGYLALSEQVKTPAPIVDSTVAFSAGAIYSTVRDLYNWNIALNSGKLLPLVNLEKAYKPYKQKYGFGFMADSLYGKRLISHGGGIYGFVSDLAYVPEDKVSVVILSNKPYHLSTTERDLLAVLYNQPYKLAEEPKEVMVDTLTLNKFVGEYELAPTFKITIVQVGGRLKAQATGQSQFDLFAKTENEFFYKVVDARVEFVKNGKGEVESLILHQNGQDIPGKKVK